jgi:hypothetical protein
VWKSTGVSGALTRPCWLGRAVKNRHRHAIEQVSRRWRGGRRGERAVNLISTQVYAEAKRRFDAFRAGDDLCGNQPVCRVTSSGEESTPPRRRAGVDKRAVKF